MAAKCETVWNLETKSRRDKCSSELRIARPKVLMASPPYPLFLKLQNRNGGCSIQLDSAEGEVISTRFHLIFAMRECFEQMHRGDHFIFEHPSNASSWNELCVQKLVAQPSVFFKLKDPCVAGICNRVNLDLSWLANDPDLAQALQQWRESASGIEFDRHVQVKNGLASAWHPVELSPS